MLDELKHIAVFCKVVDKGSFRAAAHELALSPSVVSHHISALEHKSGVTLLYRSTRKMILTEQGKILYEAAKQLVDAAQSGLNYLIGQANDPSGILKISMAAVLCKSPIMSAIAAFSKQFPKVKLNLQFSDKVEDLFEHGIDVGIRIGQLKDSHLKAVKIYQIERKLVCAPSLINNEQLDIDSLDTLPWINPSMLPAKRTFKNNDQERTIQLNSKIDVDSVEAACQLALQGAGISSPPDYLVDDYISDGKLIHILPHWQMTPLSVYLVWQPSAQPASLCSRFKASIVSYMTSKLEYNQVDMVT